MSRPVGTPQAAGGKQPPPLIPAPALLPARMPPAQYKTRPQTATAHGMKTPAGTIRGVLLPILKFPAPERLKLNVSPMSFVPRSTHQVPKDVPVLPPVSQVNAAFRTLHKLSTAASIRNPPVKTTMAVVWLMMCAAVQLVQAKVLVLLPAAAMKTEPALSATVLLTTVVTLLPGLPIAVGLQIVI